MKPPTIPKSSYFIFFYSTLLFGYSKTLTTFSIIKKFSYYIIFVKFKALKALKFKAFKSLKFKPFKAFIFLVVIRVPRFGFIIVLV